MEADEFLEHFGVKGMRWGVRKEDKPGFRQRYRDIKDAPVSAPIHLRTAKGEEVVLRELNASGFAAFFGASNKRVREALAESRSFEVSVAGKAVGDVSVLHKSPEEVNFAWVGVKKKERGKGYASTVFDAGVSYAKKEGYQRITLEVPGNAPDARHIYEKRGFKETTGEMMGTKDDIWGGLTEMALDISGKKA